LENGTTTPVHCWPQKQEETTKRNRAASVADVVQADVIATRASNGQRSNVVGREFILAVQAELADVRSNPDRLRLYQARAAEKTQAGLQSSPSQALRPMQKRKAAQLDVGAVPIADCTGSTSVLVSGQIVKASVQPHAKCFPITELLLNHTYGNMMLDGKRTGRSYLEHEQLFTKMHNTYAGAQASKTKAPPQPQKPRWMETPVGRGGQRDTIEAHLQKFLVQACSPLKFADVHLAKLLIRCSVQRVCAAGTGDAGKSTVLVLWIHIASGNMQAGVVPFRANCMQCKVIHLSADGQVELQYDRDTFIEPRRVLPFCGHGGAGIIKTHSVADVAAILLGSTPASAEFSISFSRQKVSLICGDRFLVSGVDGSVESTCLVFNRSSDEDHIAQPDAPSTSDVDWDVGVLPASTSSGAGAHGRPRAGAHGRPSVEHVFPEEITDMLDVVVASMGPDIKALVGDDESDSGADEEPEALCESDDDLPKPSHGGASSSKPSHAGASSSGVASSSAYEAPCPANVLVTLRAVEILDQVFVALPEFAIDNRWCVLHHGVVIAKINCILGHSLVCTCRIPTHIGCGTKCKMHIDIEGAFEAAQAALLRWAIHGTSCSHQYHIAAASACQNDWRALVAARAD
jgi:hypothetical protein